MARLLRRAWHGGLRRLRGRCGRRLAQLLVSYEDWALRRRRLGRAGVRVEEFAASALAVIDAAPVPGHSPDDPRLSEVEAELFQRYGHRTQLSIPLRIRDRRDRLVEVFDNRESRVPERRSRSSLPNAIRRFAALALDKARLYDEQRCTADRLDRLAGQPPAAPASSLSRLTEAGDRRTAGGPRRGGARAPSSCSACASRRRSAASGDQLVVQALAARRSRAAA